MHELRKEEQAALDQILPSKAQYDLWMAESVKIAESLLADKPTNIMPQLWIRGLTPEGGHFDQLCALANCDFNDPDRKRALLFTLGHNLYDQKQIVPRAVFLISEGWVTFKPAGQPLTQPRNDPERKECAICFGMSLGGHHNGITHIPVRRDDEDHMVKNGEARLFDGADTHILQSFFDGFFSVIRTKQN